MKSYWLHKKNSTSAILFMTGWGMDPTPFQSIKTGDHDILLVYDYHACDPDGILSEIKSYTAIHLLAWSMGVWMAGRYLTESKDMFVSATAVNGTLYPIDDTLGIPPNPFDKMIENFSQQVLETFYRDMFENSSLAEQFLKQRPERSLESIRSELETLRENYRIDGPGSDIFSRRIVTTRDRIFQARAQVRSWGKKEIEKIKGGHFPFYDGQSIDLFIDRGLQDQ